MAQTVIDSVTVIPGGGRDVVPNAAVVLDDDGCVTEIAELAGPPVADMYLLPAAVDLHMDNLVQRRRPRATVSLDHEAVISVLDAECAAAGVGTVCVAARCEDSPRKGIDIADAAVLAAAIEDLAPLLACDWRIHARVELTDDRSVDTLTAVLGVSSRVVLISMIETTAQRSRFGTLEQTRAFYAKDWGVSEAEVEEVFSVDEERLSQVAGRRLEVAALARQRGIVLASHDDGTPQHVEEAHALGARVAEFPLSMAAAERATQLGMHVVLGAPNALRGRSTSTGNVLASDAVGAGVCDVLCSDYLPSSLLAAPLALAERGAAPLQTAIDLVSTNPATVLGLPGGAIEVGQPLTASLRRIGPAGTRTQVGVALWRAGRLVFGRHWPSLAVAAG